MKLLLLDPWSQTNANTLRPVSVTLLMHDLVNDCKVLALIGPELRKYLIDCFHLEASPLIIKTVAWFAIYLVWQIWPKSSNPSIVSLPTLYRRPSLMLISSNTKTTFLSLQSIALTFTLRASSTESLKPGFLCIFWRSHWSVLIDGKIKKHESILYAFLLWNSIDRANILSFTFHLYAYLDLCDIWTCDSINAIIWEGRYCFIHAIALFNLKPLMLVFFFLSQCSCTVSLPTFLFSECFVGVSTCCLGGAKII